MLLPMLQVLGTACYKMMDISTEWNYCLTEAVSNGQKVRMSHPTSYMRIASK